MLFGSSGIRQLFSGPLVETALAVGAILGERFPDCIVGTDSRTTSPLLARAVISGITAAGGRARFTGIAPTPSVAYSARTAKAGCMITASHNPEEYNGIKLFNPDGSSFVQAQQRETEELLKEPRWADWQHQGTEVSFDALTPHKVEVLDKVSLDPGLSVVIDCGNGAGSVMTPDILAKAGVKTTCISCNPSGFFSRPSEPLAEHLGYVGEMVKKTGADCAVVHDGDADRMMAFDNRGRYIDGDHLLLLFAEHLDAHRVVTTSDASMIIEEVAEVHRTPVGDAFVSEELLSWGSFGGEPSGAWIFPQISYCPDGPFAAALFCEIASGCDVAERLDEMPAYPILRESIPHERAREVVTALGAENPTDGIRVSGESGWYLVRASGTEPKIRITAEGTTLSAAKAMLALAKERIRQGKTA
ncbi:phosphoglucomutase/phosphomannomutase alpha/beta/alpha domain I [Methanoregula boonei 6A8]|jgi:phosphoglucosamine mutase|uniref:Phosphoglucomutase/phosphomannomutase alpha/beta/alpha domain I n=1 Tax=Methanoregula boonei (strain DSM 21154 / JCM 14090 / 6A8) TaxID=456442 RepID=A7I4W6_METB6|nr:phosphopentomutase/phosphoglucosamine mutase [Methanoregula boonei]ABS54777.1 phosphoglucomutase/phosphomannomutase alpha/beta/alpha domain I [Methanoregula boonei 6A8]